jgi:hypothetical protein
MLQGLLCVGCSCCLWDATVPQPSTLDGRNDTLQAIFPSYENCLDIYTEIVVEETNLDNIIQLLLLLAQGLVVCAALSLWSRARLHDVANLRHGIYNILMVGSAHTDTGDTDAMAG